MCNKYIYIHIYIYIKVVVIPKRHIGINWYRKILFLSQIDCLDLLILIGVS